MKYINKILTAASFLLIIITSGLIFKNKKFFSNQFYKPSSQTISENTKMNNNNEISTWEIVAKNLNIPWEITFLPDGDMLVTERPGTLKRIGKNQQNYTINEVKHIGEGGLLGMALHPDFSQNNWIYFYYTTESKDTLKNVVVRYNLDHKGLTNKTIILDNIPAARNHNGGRISFGPDGYLYITTGDAQNPQLAQDIKSLAGKILRVKDDGSIPSENPYSNEVYSYGHRNPQGIAWDNQFRLWATEHGRSGFYSGFDELNLIQKGKNYGWPIIQGNETKNNMETPVINSGPNETWAPASLTFKDNSLFFTGLRGETLYQATILPDNKVSLQKHFFQQFGRLRAITLGPDGYLYISTSNTDGRGFPKKNDDKIIKINLDYFKIKKRI